MNVYQYSTLIQCVVFILYISFIIYRYGLLKSISASWYALPKNRNWLFWVFTSVLGFYMLPYSDYSPFFFLSGAGLIFVGTAAAFEDEKMTNRVHYSGAVAGIGGALLGLFLSIGTLLPLYITLLFLIGSYFIQRTHIIWWTEIGAFIGIMYGLFQLNF